MKKILCTLMSIAAFATANAAAVGDTKINIPVALQVVDGLKLNKSGDIDFGDVVINKGKVTSDPITLTATRSDTTSDSQIEISFSKSIELTGGDPSSVIYVSPLFEDNNGVVESGNNLVKTIDIAASDDEISEDIKVEMPLSGFETSDDYQGTLEVTAKII